eukprot:1597988-Pleurochrysis_carterae.AAC.1
MSNTAVTRTRRRTGSWRPARRRDPRRRFGPGRGPYLHARSRPALCGGRPPAGMPPGCLLVLPRCTGRSRRARRGWREGQ